MGKADEFRKNARRSLRLAKDAYSRAMRWHWLDIAQFWLGLARYAEERERLGGADLSSGAEKGEIGARSSAQGRAEN